MPAKSLLPSRTWVIPTLPLQVYSGRQTKFKQHPEDLHNRVPHFPKQRFGELGIVELLKLHPVSVRVLNNSVSKIRQFCMPEPPHFPEELTVQA